MAEEALIRMGFSRERANQALAASSGDLEASLTWLASHPVPIINPNLSFVQKCRLSEQQSSYTFDQRCAIRFCVLFWIVVCIFGGISMVLAGLFAFPPARFSTALALLISGIVVGVLGVILLIIWGATGLCCEHYWCCSFR